MVLSRPQLDKSRSQSPIEKRHSVAAPDGQLIAEVMNVGLILSDGRISFAA
jgi:hypothetical protein